MRPQHKADLPEYVSCAQCREYAHTALRDVGDGRYLCLNCTADERHGRARCAICSQEAPIERHHVATARQAPDLTILVCLNCHSVLSARQYRWHPAWRCEDHPVRYLVQGVYDVVTLWLERSPAVEACCELLRMLARAALLLLPHLRPGAVRDLGDLTDWSQL